jgi:hypothetical protein
MGEIISGISSIIGGNQAASAAKEASANDMKMYYQTRTDLQPYNMTGQAVLPSLQALAMSGPTGGGPDYVTQAAGERPGQMTQAELEKTPGYQWNLAQGLKATQSAAAARGLGVSGASLKGAATYATGLADNTYQNQFNNAQTRFADLLSLNTGQQGNLTNQYNRLAGVATLGEDAAAKTGAAGTALANASGNALMAAGTAQAQGTKGFGNALGSAVNDGLGYMLAGNSGGTGGYGDSTQNYANQTGLYRPGADGTSFYSGG